MANLYDDVVRFLSQNDKVHPGWCQNRHCVHNMLCTLESWYMKTCVEKLLDPVRCPCYMVVTDAKVLKKDE